MQIDTNLFQRQIEKQKINNFTATLPKPQSDLANYLLKDPYIFDLAGIKRADGAVYQPRIHDLRHTFVPSKKLSYEKYIQGAVFRERQ